jgi:hypothetical protein
MKVGSGPATAAAAVLLAAAVTSSASAAPTDSPSGPLVVETLSSRPDQVTGEDTFVRVRRAGGRPVGAVRLTLNGHDVTDSLRPSDGGLVGLVTGLRTHANTLVAKDRHRQTRLRIEDHPVTGPVTSGAHEYPFLCRTERNGLGQPLVDNQNRQGMRVFATDAGGRKTPKIIGWSRDCSAKTTVDYLYRSEQGKFLPLPPGDSRPSDMAQTKLADGRFVDFVVRRERGTINRFIYSIAMLAPRGRDNDDSYWNKKLVYSFGGGVGIGHDQGFLGMEHLPDKALGLGYAAIYSTGTSTQTHYNLLLGAETALMVKEHFIERHGPPLQTVGMGGSGGAVQQYVYGQNDGDRVIDAAIAYSSFPDMVTQTIHVGDCELLERYLDSGSGAWLRKWKDRSRLEGFAASDTEANTSTGKPGSSTCVNAWRGAIPLTMNPRWAPDTERGFGEGDPEWRITDPPGARSAVHWTYWDDLAGIFGLDSTGYARSTWGNQGVQYGLLALRDRQITPAQFLDLNAKVGTWKPASHMVQEGCPFVPAACADAGEKDPWSARNMNLSPDGGRTPAPRRDADPAAVRAAFGSGLVFRGAIDIPVIDWRNYLDARLDQHDALQSFVARERMLDHDGDASNQVIWFSEGPDLTEAALHATDVWLAARRAHPGSSAAQTRPAFVTDRCEALQPTKSQAGPRVWDGVLDSRAPGACTRMFPPHSTSRIAAGGPLRGDVFTCRLEPVSRAISHGVYGSWRPSAAERGRLKRIFPKGVCDYGNM